MGALVWYAVLVLLLAFAVLAFTVLQRQREVRRRQPPPVVEPVTVGAGAQHRRATFRAQRPAPARRHRARRG